MGALDNVMQSIAVTLTDALGTEADVTIQRVTGYDPATRRGSATSEKSTVRCVIDAYTNDQQDEQAQAGDIQVWVPGLEVEEPQAGDLFEFKDTRYRVVSVKPHYAGGLPALWECRVRR